MTIIFRPYRNIVHVDDIPSAFHGQDADGFTLVVSRRSLIFEEDLDEEELDDQEELIEAPWARELFDPVGLERIEAPWARELFDFTFGPVEYYAEC